jgi:hypothetical protein
MRPYNRQACGIVKRKICGMYEKRRLRMRLLCGMKMGQLETEGRLHIGRKTMTKQNELVKILRSIDARLAMWVQAQMDAGLTEAEARDKIARAIGFVDAERAA